MPERSDEWLKHLADRALSAWSPWGWPLLVGAATALVSISLLVTLLEPLPADLFVPKGGVLARLLLGPALAIGAGVLVRSLLRDRIGTRVLRDFRRRFPRTRRWTTDDGAIALARTILRIEDLERDEIRRGEARSQRPYSALASLLRRSPDHAVHMSMLDPLRLENELEEIAGLVSRYTAPLGCLGGVAVSAAAIALSEDFPHFVGWASLGLVVVTALTFAIGAWSRVAALDRFREVFPLHGRWPNEKPSPALVWAMRRVGEREQTEKAHGRGEGPYSTLAGLLRGSSTFHRFAPSIDGAVEASIESAIGDSPPLGRTPSGPIPIELDAAEIGNVPISADPPEPIDAVALADDLTALARAAAAGDGSTEPADRGESLWRVVRRLSCRLRGFRGTGRPMLSPLGLAMLHTDEEFQVLLSGGEEFRGETLPPDLVEALAPLRAMHRFHRDGFALDLDLWRTARRALELPRGTSGRDRRAIASVEAEMRTFLPISVGGPTAGQAMAIRAAMRRLRDLADGESTSGGGIDGGLALPTFGGLAQLLERSEIFGEHLRDATATRTVEPPNASSKVDGEDADTPAREPTRRIVVPVSRIRTATSARDVRAEGAGPPEPPSTRVVEPNPIPLELPETRRREADHEPPEREARP